MSWTDGYLQAKFRGVDFYVRSANTKSGRRLALHSYPRQDQTDKEDLGSADTEFTLAAYVVGDDYYDKRNALEDALRAGGEGKLVHPYRGVLNVVVQTWSEEETTDEGRMARFNITFLIQGDKNLTTGSPNTTQKVFDAKSSLLDAVQEWFEDAYDLALKPATAISDARETLDSVFSIVDSAKRVVGAVAEFQREIENAKGDVIALSLNVQDLFAEIRDLVNFGTDISNGSAFTASASNAQDQSREQRQILASQSRPIVATPAEIAEDDSYPAYQIQQATRLSALAAEIGLVALVPFATVQDAESAQDQLFETIDAFQELPWITDGIFEALSDCRQAIFNDLQGRILNLPLLVDYELMAETNSLALCYELYGNLENEQELIDRNGIVHPGFFPRGTIQITVNSDD